MRHKNDLRNGNHHSIYLQRAYEKYGEECFLFEVLEEILDEKELQERELSLLPSGEYNVSLVSSGGDLISYHPNLEEIKKLHSENSKKMWSKLSEEEREKRKIAIRGEGNPMFGKKHSEETKRKMSENHARKNGEEHWAYGKERSEAHCKAISEARKGSIPWNKGKEMSPLSEETKQKISESLKGRKGSNNKSVVCGGIEFESIVSAAKHYGVSSTAIIQRIRSKTERFADYYYNEKL